MVALCQTKCTIYCFCYAKYCKAMEEITGFSMKDSLSAPGLGWIYFNSMRDETDEPIYTYNDKYMQFFCTKKHKRRYMCGFQSIIYIKNL